MAYSIIVVYILLGDLYVIFFFSSRRRHTRCALVTGVQTCALPIFDPSISQAPHCRWAAARTGKRRRRPIADPASANLPEWPRHIRSGCVRHLCLLCEDGIARLPCAPDRAPEALTKHAPAATAPSGRSGEHTSELQSLMRISYA